MHFDRQIYTFQFTLKHSLSHTRTHHTDVQLPFHVCAITHANTHSHCPFIQMIPSDAVGKDLPRIVSVIMFIRFCTCVMADMIALKTSLAVVCAPRLITLGLMKWEIKVHLATRSYLLIHVVQKLMSNASPSSALAKLKTFQP